MTFHPCWVRIELIFWAESSATKQPLLGLIFSPSWAEISALFLGIFGSFLRLHVGPPLVLCVVPIFLLDLNLEHEIRVALSPLLAIILGYFPHDSIEAHQPLMEVCHHGCYHLSPRRLRPTSTSIIRSQPLAPSHWGIYALSFTCPNHLNLTLPILSTTEVTPTLSRIASFMILSLIVLLPHIHNSC